MCWGSELPRMVLTCSTSVISVEGTEGASARPCTSSHSVMESHLLQHAATFQPSYTPVRLSQQQGRSQFTKRLHQALDVIVLAQSTKVHPS